MAVQFDPFTGNLDIVGAGASATPGGSDTQVQFNNAGAFGGSADLTWDDTGKVLGVGGDIDLDAGGTYATTLQVITPTANRTISFPDATGTLALVAGSSGQLTYNSAGANAGVPNSVIGATGDVTLGLAGAASTPPLKLTGTWFTGGTATTTKPQVLIEPAGTTSTAWSTSGTGFGVNAASGFAGNLLDLQVNGTSQVKVTSAGNIFIPSTAVLTSSNWTGINGGGNTGTLNGVAIRSNALILGSGGLFGWGNTTDPINSQDLFLARDAANTLAQRNGTNAQTYRLYNSYTDASNYERVAFKWDTNTFKIEPEAAGTGTLRSLAFSANGAASTPPVSLTGTWFSGGTSTTTKPALLIEPTGTTSTAWSTSGTGFGVNAPSGFAGNLLDLQVNGTSQLRVSSAGIISRGSTAQIDFNANSAGRLRLQSNNATGGIYINGVDIHIAQAGFYGWDQSGSPGSGTCDLTVFRDAANTLAQRNGTNAQTLRVYGTYTDLSNHVRGSLSATSTAVTLAAETAGTGADDIPLNLTAAGTGTVKVNSVAEVAVSSTVAGLPATPAVGMLTRVTDASAPAVGFTVAGGGAAAALVWWNGSNWTVIGV